ncbi:MAG: hypothetical protein IKB33_01855 [Spirochaetaceae bacterium]|nr:hypothetical protein [Spirochaetaceae bacterium]
MGAITFVGVGSRTSEMGCLRVGLIAAFILAIVPVALSILLPLTSEIVGFCRYRHLPADCALYLGGAVFIVRFWLVTTGLELSIALPCTGFFLAVAIVTSAGVVATAFTARTGIVSAASVVFGASIPTGAAVASSTNVLSIVASAGVVAAAFTARAGIAAAASVVSGASIPTGAAVASSTSVLAGASAVIVATTVASLLLLWCAGVHLRLAARQCQQTSDCYQQDKACQHKLLGFLHFRILLIQNFFSRANCRNEIRENDLNAMRPQTEIPPAASLYGKGNLRCK